MRVPSRMVMIAPFEQLAEQVSPPSPQAGCFGDAWPRPHPKPMVAEPRQRHRRLLDRPITQTTATPLRHRGTTRWNEAETLLAAR